MKIGKILLYSVILLTSLSLVTCEDELKMSMSYPEMLKQAYDVNGEGRIIPLTIEKAIEVDGTLNKNGKYLYYASNSDRGNYDIYLRSMRDITIVRVTEHSSRDYAPAISPNGRYLAYVSERADPEGDVYVVRLDARSMIKKERGKKEKVDPLDSKAKNITVQLVEGSDQKRVIKDANPTWNSKSNRIAFSSERNGLENIFISKRNGKDAVQLTSKGGMYPRFSPDDKSIIYISYQDSKSRGDVYQVDIETKEIKRLTETSYIEMFPSYLGNSDEIVYTLFDKDTNADGVIDLNDKSILQYKNLKTGVSYPLTFYSVSSFAAKYFSTYQLLYEQSEELNFSGVIVYAQQVGDNIDLNIIPEYGVIPKRTTAKHQYETALVYLNEYNDYDRYITGLLRVYYFFKDDKSELSKIYITRALKRAALDSYKNGDKQKSSELLALFTSIQGEDKDNAYASLTSKYLAKELAGQNGEKTLLTTFESLDKNSPYRAFLIQDIGDFYLAKGNKTKAKEYYTLLINEYPDYTAIQSINLELAELSYDKPGAEISPYYIEIFNKGNAYQRDEAMKKLISLYQSKLLPAERVEIAEALIEKHPQKGSKADTLIHAMAVYLKSYAFYVQNNHLIVKKELNDSLELLTSEDILYYRSGKLLADMAQRENNPADEEKHLSKIINFYKPRWKQKDLDEVIVRLISFYENKGRTFEEKGNYKQAANVYKGYTKFLTTLKDSNIKSFESLYDDYTAQAHVLYIDAYHRSKKNSYKSLQKLEQVYSEGAQKARKNFDKGHIYGLGYIYTKMAIYLDDEYKKKGNLDKINSKLLSDTEKLKPESIAEFFRLAVDTLDWSLFMDDTFSDPYLLKGWIYQYVDARRQRSIEQETEMAQHFSKYFPEYLLETNVDIYTRSLDANNELQNPEIEGNIHLNLANTYFNLVNWREALNHYKAASKYKSKFSSKEQEALFYFHVGYCYYQLGDIKLAREEMNKVLFLYEDITGGAIKKKYVRSFYNLFRYYALFARLDDNYVEAIKWYKDILDIGAKYNYEIDRARFIQEIAYCHIQLKNYNQAFEYIKKADKLLTSYEKYEKKYNLDFKILFFPPIPINLGADSAVFGPTRLYTDLDYFTKTFYSLTLKEMIYYTKGDYLNVIKVQKEKLEYLEDKKLKIHKEIKLRTLNNLAHAYFVMENHEVSEKTFKKAWKYAEELNDLDGMFQTIQNLTSVYGFLFENNPDYYSNPVKTIDDFVKKIDKYKSTFIKERLAEKWDKLKKNNKLRELPAPTQEDKVALMKKVEQEAADKFFDLDIYRSTMHFYKGEILYSTYKLQYKDKSKLTPQLAYTTNRDIYALYADSARIFEFSLKNDKVEKRMKLKLMMNASVCRERLGQISESFGFLEEAQKVAEKYKYDDVLFQIYFKEAIFIQEYGKQVGYSQSKVDELYAKSLELIEEIPQRFVSRRTKINSIYDSYSLYLAEKNSAAKSFEIRERKRRFNLINRIYLAAPEFKNQSDKEDYYNYKLIVNNLINKKRRLSKTIEKEDSIYHKDVLAQAKEIDSLKDSIKNIRETAGLFHNFVVFEKGVEFNYENAVVYDVEKIGNRLIYWKVSKDGISVSDNEFSNVAAMGTFLVDEYASNDDSLEVYQIFNKSVTVIPPLSNKSLASPSFMYIFSTDDLGILYSNKSSLFKKAYAIEKGVSEDITKETDLLQYSVIIDDSSNLFSLSEALFSGKLKPSLLVRSSKADNYENLPLLYYALLYSGGSNIVFEENKSLFDIDKSEVAVKNIVNLSDVNSVPYAGTFSMAMGKNSVIVSAESEYANISKNLYDSYQEELLLGDIEDAKFYLFRWKEIAGKVENSDITFALAIANLFDYESKTEKSIIELEKIKLDKITDASLKSSVLEHKLFYRLKIGDIEAAKKLLGEIEKDEIELAAKKEIQYYKDLVNSLEKGSATISVLESGAIDPVQLATMISKYQLINGNKSEAVNLIKTYLSPDKALSFEDLFYVNTFATFGRERVLDDRLKEIFSILTSQSAVEADNAFDQTLLTQGAYDRYSKYSVAYLMTRLSQLSRTGEYSNASLESHFDGLAIKGDKLTALAYFSLLREPYKAYNTQEYMNILDRQIKMCDDLKAKELKASLYYAKAIAYAEEGNYNSAKKFLQLISKLPVEHALYDDVSLLQAEVLLIAGKLEDASEIISTFQPKTKEQALHKKLLALYSDVISAIKQGESKALYISQAKQKLDLLLNEFDASKYRLSTYQRKNLFIAILDALIKLENQSGDYLSAVRMSDIKKTFIFATSIETSTDLTFATKPAEETELSSDDKAASEESVAPKESEKAPDNEKMIASSKLFAKTKSVFSIKPKLADNELIVCLEPVDSSIVAWVISANGTKVIELSNSMSTYEQVLASYTSNLASAYNMGEVNASFTSLFANVLEEAQKYEQVYIVTADSLESTPFEIMGESIPFVEQRKVSFLPTVSSYSASVSTQEAKAVVVLQPISPAMNDRLELLALKEAGYSNVAAKPINDAYLHMQKLLYYDKYTKRLTVGLDDYSEIVSGSGFVYYSSNSANIISANTFALLNMSLGSGGIVINNTQMRDVNSAILVREFYTGIMQQSSVSDSFYSARKRVYANPKFSHPMYWINTRLYGVVTK